MKRKVLLCLLALLIALPLASFATTTEETEVPAYDPGVFFTHPELGEQILVDYHHGQPEIIIYGMPYYVVVDTQETPYRGLTANDIKVVTEDMPDPYTALEQFYTSATTDEDGKPPFEFEYAGLPKENVEKLNTLPEEDRFDALMLLYGFRGADGYDLLKAMPGFEDVDTEALKANHKEYTVVIDGVTYPYRIIMFRVDEIGGESYYERYNFVYYMNEWRLARITVEYVEGYDERVKDIYGSAFAVEALDIGADDADAFRGVSWTATQEEVIAAEGGTLEGNTLKKGPVTIYKLQADLSYVFDDDGNLLYREYTLPDDGDVSFTSAFVSLYMRYVDPIEIDAGKNKTWVMEDVRIELIHDEHNSTIRFIPRTDS